MQVVGTVSNIVDDNPWLMNMPCGYSRSEGQCLATIDVIY